MRQPQGKWLTIVITVLLFGISLVPVTAQGTTLHVIGWNLESDEIDIDVMQAELGAFEDVHIWGLSEINADLAEAFEEGIEIGEGVNYEGILGTTGNNIRLLIIYDTDRLELIASQELSDINVGGTLRAPLVAEFKDNLTDEHFLFMVNHLVRGQGVDPRRLEQATLLNAWAQAQDLPVIAVGDYNFDITITGGDTEKGFDQLTANDIWEWVRPETLIRTQCSAGANDKANGVPEDQSCTFNSVLDFVFVSGEAQDWTAESVIVVRDSDFPDDNTTSDHRPVSAAFMFGSDVPEVVTKDMLLDHIETLEAELAELRTLVEQLP